MMFLCLPMIFIISISEIRSDRSFSVASAGGKINHIRIIGQCCVDEKAQKGLTIITFQSIYNNIAAIAELGWRLSWRMLPGERYLKYETINATFPTSSLLCAV